MDPLVLRLLLAAKQQDLAALRQLHALIELVAQIGDVVHHLQRERGLSNLVMYTPQTSFQIQLNDQAKLVEQALENTARVIQNIMSSGYISAARLQTSIALALQSSFGLPEIRKSVQHYQLQQEVSQAPCEKYSVLIRLWLDVVIDAAGLSVSAQVSRSVLSLIYLLQAKEYAGQERAWGVIAFSGKAAGGELVERLQVLGQSQNDALRALWPVIDAESSRQFQPYFEQDTDQQYAELKQLMLGLCVHSQASPALAELWYQSATQRIDVLHSMLEPVKANLELQLTNSRQIYDKEQRLLQLHRTEQVGITKDNGPPLIPSTVKYPEQASLLHLLREQSHYISNIEAELCNARIAVQELKIIQRAKLLLIDQHQLTEQQAHHQLQKLAMDRQESLAKVAEQVVEKFAIRNKKSAKSI
ncbi:nitrate- and nitrite sensing domain-containing protein [Rheinheimera texasensis]|uniref:nitrate- and nitrite sensing domain-containing protein n=1 Tax=Rheinheimera texasensis TaxID=306205 RepID=UPI0004E22C36|nr:nitrate- and nitrite sensing domain-containing protein [Rheinheimera texasensis]